MKHQLATVARLFYASMCVWSTISIAEESPSGPTPDKPTESRMAPTVFNTYAEAIAAAGDRLLAFDYSPPLFTGYSAIPIVGREKAIKESLGKAAKAKTTTFLLFFDGNKTFPPEAPPPGSILGGSYSVYSIMPVTFVEKTPENVLAQIKLHVTSTIGSFSQPHIRALLEMAKDPAFKSQTAEFRALIREYNFDRISGFGVPGLVGLLQLHDGDACVPDLIKWIKFHKNAQVRFASYRALIALGKITEVEENLKGEQDKRVKDAVQKLLI